MFICLKKGETISSLLKKQLKCTIADGQTMKLITVLLKVKKFYKLGAKS